MSALLTDPTVVLALTDTEDRAAEIRDAVLDGRATAVERMPSATLAADRLDEGADVGCVVVTDGLPSDDVVDACAHLREASELIPVVAWVSDGDEDLARRITTVGRTRYVPTDAPAGALQDAVSGAIDDYERQRRRAEESSILTSLLEEVGVSVYAKDRQGRHVRAAKVPGGYSPQELRGMTDLDIYADEDPKMAREAYRDDLAVIRDEKPVFERDEMFQTESGEQWSRTTKVPWRGEDDEVKGLVGVSWDITDYVKLERRLERQEERIEQFASYVTHDLRNPLQVATGALELGRETGDDESLEKAADALQRMDDILDDLTELAKEQRDSVTLEVEEPSEEDFASGVPLAALAREVWDVIETGEATLDIAVPEAAIVNTPESSVRPVLENLFKNAIDHGGDDVTVTVGIIPEGGFYVADDGPGIPEDERDQVFEEGYTTSPDGSGTGLSIVSETADQHEWDAVAAESADGGARIEIRNCLLVERPDLGVGRGEELTLRTGADVGDVELDGDEEYDEETGQWTVAGAGANIWRQENDFRFVYTPADGPVRIQARIVDIEELSEYSKAGVMVRSGLTDDASYGYIGVTPRHGTELLWRTRQGIDGISQHMEEESLTYPWYRVDRVEDTVTTWLSADGEDWYPIDQRRIEVGEEAYVGLVVCSFTPRRLCEATFADVSAHRLEPVE